jgi:hypothetical protein
MTHSCTATSSDSAFRRGRCFSPASPAAHQADYDPRLPHIAALPRGLSSSVSDLDELWRRANPSSSRLRARTRANDPGAGLTAAQAFILDVVGLIALP